MDDLDADGDGGVDVPTTSSIFIQYSAKSIKYFLKNNPSEWIIQSKNKYSNMKQSEVWDLFGEPSKMNEYGVFTVIDGFVSCFNCSTTYVNKKDTGTTSLRNHGCFKKYLLQKRKEEKEINTTSSQTTTSTTLCSSSTVNSNTSPLTKYGLVLKTAKLTSHEKTKAKELIVKWLCQSMRPFSLVNDNGLRNFIQQAISLGAKYGNIDVNLVVPHRTTITEHSKSMANIYRTKLKSNFIDLLRYKSLTLSPDLWTDKFNSSSYLGITCTIINSNFSFSTFDLAMHKYTEPDKKSENIAIAMNKALAPFDFYFSDTNIMCDRGSNFVKCFKDYDPLHCYAHRLNNIIKKCFFQNNKKRTADTSSHLMTTTSAIGVSGTLSSSDDDSCDEADDELVPSIKLKLKRLANGNNKRTKKKNSSLSFVDHVKFDVSDIPIEAREYLIKLKEVKQIIKYVKKAGLNDEIKATASISLKQSTSVRWLSLINSLQSFHRAYKATKKVLHKHDKQVNVSPNDLKWIIRLLLPFKVITEKVQTGNTPSLHMVLLSTLILRHTLSSTEELQRFFANFNNEEKENNNDADGQVDSEDDELNVETEPIGITFFRERLECLLENMFQLDKRHYVAVLLHPKYSKMLNCSKNEIEQTYKWVRQELKNIIIDDTMDNSLMSESSLKKKNKSSLFEMFSNSSISNSTRTISDAEEEDNDEDPESYMLSHDELNHYLFLLKQTENEPESQNEDPLPWWKTHNSQLKKLSILARQLFSIPATSASVERQFSSAGIIFNDRRTRLTGENLENIILIRSMENQDKNDVGTSD